MGVTTLLDLLEVHPFCKNKDELDDATLEVHVVVAVVQVFVLQVLASVTRVHKLVKGRSRQGPLSPARPRTHVGEQVDQNPNQCREKTPSQHVIELLSQAGIHGLKKMPLALDCAR